MKNKIFARCIMVDDNCSLTPEQPYRLIDEFQDMWLIEDDFNTLIYVLKDWFGNTYELLIGGK